MIVNDLQDVSGNHFLDWKRSDGFGLLSRIGFDVWRIEWFTSRHQLLDLLRNVSEISVESHQLRLSGRIHPVLRARMSKKKIRWWECQNVFAMVMRVKTPIQLTSFEVPSGWRRRRRRRRRWSEKFQFFHRPRPSHLVTPKEGKQRTTNTRICQWQIVSDMHQSKKQANNVRLNWDVKFEAFGKVTLKREVDSEVEVLLIQIGDSPLFFPIRLRTFIYRSSLYFVFVAQKFRVKISRWSSKWSMSKESQNSLKLNTTSRAIEDKAISQTLRKQ